MRSDVPAGAAIVLAQAKDLQPVTIVMLVACAVILLVFLVVLFLFMSLLRIWLMAFLSRANVSVFELLGMKLRRTPVNDIVKWKIMAAQAGVPVTTPQIESAWLQGVDTERAILAMIRAQQTGVSLTWQEVIEEDADQRLRKKLYGE